jgi:hypothetical protein
MPSLQLLPHQTRQRIHVVGYRSLHDRTQCCAKGERDRPAGQDRSQARSDRVCGHQPLSRRPYWSGRLISESDPADWREGMGSDHQPEARPRRKFQAVRRLDQGREQGRASLRPRSRGGSICREGPTSGHVQRSKLRGIRSPRRHGRAPSPGLGRKKPSSLAGRCRSRAQPIIEASASGWRSCKRPCGALFYPPFGVRYCPDGARLIRRDPRR